DFQLARLQAREADRSPGLWQLRRAAVHHRSTAPAYACFDRRVRRHRGARTHARDPLARSGSLGLGRFRERSAAEEDYRIGKLSRPARCDTWLLLKATGL